MAVNNFNAGLIEAFEITATKPLQCWHLTPLAEKFFSAHESLSLSKEGKAMPVMTLRKEGINLVIEYYQEKYGANITPTGPLQDTNVMNFVDRPDNHTIEYRHAFLVGAYTFHGTPLIYLYKAGEEGILLSDSAGSVTLEEAQKLANQLKVPLYFTPDAKKSDYSSCFTDGIIVGRDATAQQNGSYTSPDLLKTIQSSVIKRYGEYLFEVKLPSVFLKTTQIPSFFNKHFDAKQMDQSVHVSHSQQTPMSENILQFRKRYEVPNVFYKDMKLLMKTLIYDIRD